MTTREEAIHAWTAAGVFDPESWVSDIEADVSKHGIGAAQDVWDATVDHGSADGDERYAAALAATFEYLADS